MALADTNTLVNLEDIKAPAIAENEHDPENMIVSHDTNVVKENMIGSHDTNVAEGKTRDVIRKEVRFADEIGSEVTPESDEQDPASAISCESSSEIAAIKSELDTTCCSPSEIECAPAVESVSDVSPVVELHEPEPITDVDSIEPNCVPCEQEVLIPTFPSGELSEPIETPDPVVSASETVPVSSKSQELRVAADISSEPCESNPAPFCESSESGQAPDILPSDPTCKSSDPSSDPELKPAASSSEPELESKPVSSSEPETLAFDEFIEPTCELEQSNIDSRKQELPNELDEPVPLVSSVTDLSDPKSEPTVASVEQAVEIPAGQLSASPNDSSVQLCVSSVDQLTEPSLPSPSLQITCELADKNFSDSPKSDLSRDPLTITTPDPILAGGSSADHESESESETTEGVTCCPHAHQFVNDLSEEDNSEEESVPDITQLRKERRQKKKKKKQQRLQKCCSGCDAHGAISPITPDLPEPIGLGAGMMQCNVVKTFDEIVQTRYDSEEEIDAAIKSYSTIGGRLANQHEQTFSDVDIAGYKSRSECGSPESDPDLLVCDYSNSVGRKLANRNLNKNLNKNDDLDECIGGFLLDSLNQNLDPKSRLFAMSVDDLTVLVKTLKVKLQNVSEDLVNVVRENDELKAEKDIISKHISQLTRLAQGQRANDNSAFRKILVTRETDI